jgi:hypothetical protein
MTKAMPQFFGTRERKCSNASNPPAEAPMPMMGNETRAPGDCGFCGLFAFPETTATGFFRRRSEADFVFTILWVAILESDGAAATTGLAAERASKAVPPPPGARRLPFRNGH